MEGFAHHMVTIAFHLDEAGNQILGVGVDLHDPARAVLAPATSAVLRVLVMAPDARFTMRELAGMAGVSHNAAQTVVHRLAEHGVVRTTPAGRALLCSFNRAHLAADAIASLVTLRTRLLQVLAEEVGAWPTPPVHASLYGSAARGDGTTASDLDLLVVRPELLDTRAEEAWEDQLGVSAGRLRLVTGNPVNYLDMSPDGLQEAARTGEPIVDSWRQDAVHLFGQRLDTLLRANR
jgi:MarR family/Nucleotidyltransferase domain